MSPTVAALAIGSYSPDFPDSIRKPGAITASNMRGETFRMAMPAAELNRAPRGWTR